MVKRVLAKTGGAGGNKKKGPPEANSLLVSNVPQLLRRSTIFVVSLVALFCLVSVRQQKRYGDWYLQGTTASSGGSGSGNSSSGRKNGTAPHAAQKRPGTCFLGGQNGASISISTATSFCRSCWAHHEASPIMTLWKGMESQLHEAALESFYDCHGWKGEALLHKDRFHQLTQNMFAALTSYRLKKSI